MILPLLMVLFFFCGSVVAVEDPLTHDPIDSSSGRCAKGMSEFRRLLAWHNYIVQPLHYFKSNRSRDVLNAIRDDMRHFFLHGAGKAWDQSLAVELKKLNKDFILPKEKVYGFGKRIASDETKAKVQEAFATIRMADLDVPFDYAQEAITAQKQSWINFLNYSEKYAGAIAYSRDLNTYDDQKNQIDAAFKKHISVFRQNVNTAYDKTRIIEPDHLKIPDDQRDFIMKRHPFSIIVGPHDELAKINDIHFKGRQYKVIALIDNFGAGDCGFFSLRTTRKSMMNNLSKHIWAKDLIIEEVLHERPEEFNKNFGSVGDHELKADMKKLIKERSESDKSKGYHEKIDVTDLVAKEENTKTKPTNEAFQAFKVKWGHLYARKIYSDSGVWLTQPPLFTTHRNIIDAFSRLYNISPFFFAVNGQKYGMKERDLIAHDYEQDLDKVDGFITARLSLILYQTDSHFQTCVPVYSY